MLNLSFIHQQISSALSVLSALLLIPLIFRYKDSKMNFYQLSMYICLLSITWGINGLLHFHVNKAKDELIDFTQ